MSAHVGILFSEEMFDWRDCIMKNIRKNLEERITFSTCTDDEYVDVKKRDAITSEWSNAAVLVIMVSPAFLQRLLKSNSISFPKFPLKSKVYFLFCGVEIDCLEKNELKSRFYNYNCIQKHDHTRVGELVESVVKVLSNTDLKHPDYSKDPSTLQHSFRKSELKKFDLIPKVVLLEQKKPMMMIVTFEDDLDLNDDVTFELDGVCDKKSLKHERLAQNIFRISLIKEITPGQGKISLFVNNKRVGFHSFTVHSMATQTPLFNILDSILSLFQNKQSLNLEELDKIISSELSSESNLRADVLEKYEKQDLQLLAQLATKHNLRETCGMLSKLDRNKLQRKTVQPVQSIVRNISPSPKVASKLKECVSTMPEHQRELIEILNKVKLGEITVANAEDLFKYWNFKHGDNNNLEKSQSRLNLSVDKGKKIGVPKLPKLEHAFEKHLSISPFRKFSLPEDKKEQNLLCRQSIPNFYSGMNQRLAFSHKIRDSKPGTPPTYANSISDDATSSPSIQKYPMSPYIAMDGNKVTTDDNKVTMDGNKVTEPDYELDVPIASLKLDAEDDTYDLSICPKYANIARQNSCVVLHKPSPTIKKKPIPVRRTKFTS